MLGIGREHKGLVSCFSYYLLCFCIVVNYFLMIVVSCEMIFVCSFFAFFVSGPFNQEFLLRGNCFLSISKVKGVLILNHSLGRLPYFIHHNQTSSLSLSFELLDFLSLFIFVLGFKAANSIGGTFLLLTLKKSRN